MRTLLTSAASDLARVLDRAGFSSEGIADHLGLSAYAALFRREPAAVRRATSSDTELGFFILTLLLHDPAPRTLWVQHLGGPLVDALTSAGALEPYGGAGQLRCRIDIRPHDFGGESEYWVFSDADASMPGHVPGKEHVLGVGAASLSLAQSVPTSAVSSVLDLGTGCGIQLLAQAGSADRLVGTDIHPRALDFAEASCNAAGLGDKVELLEGAWFEPVAGRRFDRIVSNPPFVVGPPTVGHIYRDSGLSLDGASELVVSQVADYLKVGGTAHLVAAWAHTAHQDWQQRVASWLPETGVSAWVLQRDVVDPEMYVGTWLRDESLDTADPATFPKATAWLDFFEQHSVTGIGFGFVAIQKIDAGAPSEIVAEELRHDYAQPLGPEIEEYFARMAWLRNSSFDDIASSRFVLRPGVCLERISISQGDAMGFSPAVIRLTRTDGPRWSHDVDEHIAAIVAGLRPDGLDLQETAALYFLAQNDSFAPNADNETEPETSDEFLPSLMSAIVDLIRHGFVLPAEILKKD